MLAQAHAAGVARAKSAELLEGAVRWVLGLRTDAGFPSLESPQGKRESARTAWCYGDPGVAAALMIAGRRTGEPRWESEALSVARAASRRAEGDAGIVDAGICHGAAGLAHIWNRFFQATGDEELRSAARAWFARTLDMRTPGAGLAGYRTWGVGAGEGLSWVSDASMLGGVTGIALTLAAAVSSEPPAWDRILMVNL